jgi:hypothetical protein
MDLCVLSLRGSRQAEQGSQGSDREMSKYSDQLLDDSDFGRRDRSETEKRHQMTVQAAYLLCCQHACKQFQGRQKECNRGWWDLLMG